MQSLILLLTLSVTTCAWAQDSSAKLKKDRACLPLISNFDKRADRTLVQTQPFLLGGAFWQDRNSGVLKHGNQMDDWGFAIAFLYSYQGKQYSKPNEIKLEALYEGWDYRYEKDHKLSFEIDGGEIIALPPPTRTSEILITNRKREHLSTTLALSEFEKLANSKKIRLRANDDKFELSTCEYSSLHNFYQSIK
jgi:hypothetical protein